MRAPRWAWGLGRPMPVYVTRKTAKGETASYSISLWQSLTALLLVWANVVLWGVVGIVHAVQSLV